MYPDDAGSPAASFPDSMSFALDDSDLEHQIAQAVAGFDMGAVADQPPPADPHAAFKPGDLVKGTVLVVSEKDVLLDIGGKVQGLVGRDEFLPGYEPPVGSELNVIVDSVDAASHLLKLSKKQADVAVLWRDLKVGDVVEGVVSAMNKGGLEIAIKGLLRGFIPASQVDTRFLKDISELFGQTVRCEVTKIDRDSQNLVVSRRKVLEKEAAENKTRMLGELAEGQVRRGRVRNVTDFGAFVDLGGIDGLLHVSDMSWGRIEKPGDLVKVGDEIDVQVVKVNRDTGKLSLGIKQLHPNPWDSVSQRYSPGMTIKGRIVRHADFGAFVEIEPGVEGLVALGEMSWTRRVRHAREVCQVGDVVDVAVLAVDQEKHRISLSLKQVTEDPWARVAEKYPVGGKLNVKVLRFAEFGAFVELAPGVEGMIHISELSPQRVKTVGDVLKIGQEVEARVLRVDEENHKIALSLRPPPEEYTPAPAPAQSDRPAPRKPSKPRRGGIDFEWDEPLIKLDPSKYARG